MAIFYVDGVGGSDSNGGTGTGDAWLTIQKAIDEVIATTVVALDRIHIMATGDYNLAGTPLSLTGWATNHIFFYGANASGVVDGTRPKITTTVAQSELLDATISTLIYWTLIDWDANAGTATNCIDHSTVVGYGNYYYCKFHGATSGYGVKQSYNGGQSRLKHFRNEFYDNDKGVHARDAQIHQCWIHDNTSKGIEAPYNSIYGCVVGNRVEGSTYGIEAVSSGPNGIIAGNLIYNCTYGIVTAYNSGGMAFSNEIVGCLYPYRGSGATSYLHLFNNNIFDYTGRWSNMDIEYDHGEETTLDPEYIAPLSGDFDRRSDNLLDSKAAYRQHIGPGTFLPKFDYLAAPDGNSHQWIGAIQPGIVASPPVLNPGTPEWLVIDTLVTDADTPAYPTYQAGDLVIVFAFRDSMSGLGACTKGATATQTYASNSGTSPCIGFYVATSATSVPAESWANADNCIVVVMRPSNAVRTMTLDSGFIRSGYSTVLQQLTTDPTSEQDTVWLVCNLTESTGISVVDAEYTEVVQGTYNAGVRAYGIFTTLPSTTAPATDMETPTSRSYTTIYVSLPVIQDAQASGIVEGGAASVLGAGTFNGGFA